MEMFEFDLNSQMPFPVIKVFVRDDGGVCYERDNASHILLGSTPAASRKEALLRAQALGDYSRGTVMRHKTISETGTGLTYQQLVDQTVEAVQLSRTVEADYMSKAMSKRRRHRR